MSENQNQESQKVPVSELPPATMVAVKAGDYHRLLQTAMSLFDEKLSLIEEAREAKEEVNLRRAEVAAAQSQVTLIKGRLSQVEEAANVMADALKEISDIEHKTDGGDWDEIEEAQSIAMQALNEATEIAGNLPPIQTACAYCHEKMMRGSMSAEEFQAAIEDHVFACDKRPEAELLKIIMWMAEERGIDYSKEENVGTVVRKARAWFEEKMEQARAEGAASK